MLLCYLLSMCFYSKIVIFHISVFHVFCFHFHFLLYYINFSPQFKNKTNLKKSNLATQFWWNTKQISKKTKNKKTLILAVFLLVASLKHISQKIEIILHDMINSIFLFFKNTILIFRTLIKFRFFSHNFFLYLSCPTVYPSYNLA